jgi:hypothetical protein
MAADLHLHGRLAGVDIAAVVQFKAHHKLAGTPSQFISRLPVPKETTTLGFRLPRSALKAFTVGVIAAASGPPVPFAERPVTVAEREKGMPRP